MNNVDYNQIYKSSGLVGEIHTKYAIVRGVLSIILDEKGKGNPEKDQVIIKRGIEVPGIGGESSIQCISFRIPIREVLKINMACGETREEDLQFKEVAEEDAGAPLEILLKTAVIQDEYFFKKFIRLLNDVPICGVSFEGENVGMEGIVSWIVLHIENTLVAIDVATLSETVPTFWEELKVNLFQSKDLLKVFYNSSPAAEFLLQLDRIVMCNVFDCQQVSNMICSKMKKKKETKSLADLLEEHLMEFLHPEEIAFIRKYEIAEKERPKSKRSPFLQRPLPPPKYSKLCALRTKHLISLFQALNSKLP